MRHGSDKTPIAELFPSAARWVVLAEQLALCDRAVRGVLAPLAAQRELSQSQFWLLLACRKAPPAGLDQSHLAATLSLSPAQVSAQVEQLRLKGLLERHRGRPDRRRQFWRLTPAGEAALRGILADLADWAARIDQRLAGGRVAALVGLLNELSGVLRQGRAGAGQGASGPRPYHGAGGPGDDAPDEGIGRSLQRDRDQPRRAAS